MINLETDRLIIRNWEERDRDLFFEINSDETVMHYFPFRRTREEADEVFDRVRAMLADSGFGFYALELRDSGDTIGYGSLVKTDHLEPFIPAGSVEIGWRMAVRHWGKGLASEAARALLAHGFEHHGLDEIVSFTVVDNARSRAVMERIGMHRDHDADFDHPRVADSFPHLKPHALYRITADEWRSRT
jgi:RimJ/RimL family protein N-acetyltransferase